MLKRTLTTFSVGLALIAALLWLVQRSGEKLLYLDTRYNYLTVEMTEIRGALGHPRQAGEGTAWCLTAVEGSLVVRRLTIGHVKFSSLGPQFATLDALMSTEKTSDVVAVSSFRVPLLPVGVAAALLAAVVSLAPLVRHWFRRRANRCVVCGYRLVGLASNRCPECGTALPGDRGLARQT
jgi:hypothetical protein